MMVTTEVGLQSILILWETYKGQVSRAIDTSNSDRLWRRKWRWIDGSLLSEAHLSGAKFWAFCPQPSSVGLSPSLSQELNYESIEDWLLSEWKFPT